MAKKDQSNFWLWILIIFIIGMIAYLIWNYFSKQKPQPQQIQQEQTLFRFDGILLIISSMVLSIQNLGINLFGINPFGTIQIASILLSIYVLIHGFGLILKVIKQ